MVDFLLHVKSKLKSKFEFLSFFFFATRIEKLAIDLSRGPRSAKTVCVLRCYFLCAHPLIKKGTYLFIRVGNRIDVFNELSYEAILNLLVLE